MHQILFIYATRRMAEHDIWKPLHHHQTKICFDAIRDFEHKINWHLPHTASIWMVQQYASWISIGKTYSLAQSRDWISLSMIVVSNAQKVNLLPPMFVFLLFPVLGNFHIDNLFQLIPKCVTRALIYFGCWLHSFTFTVFCILFDLYIYLQLFFLLLFSKYDFPFSLFLSLFFINSK